MLENAHHPAEGPGIDEARPEGQNEAQLEDQGPDRWALT